MTNQRYFLLKALSELVLQFCDSFDLDRVFLGFIGWSLHRKIMHATKLKYLITILQTDLITCFGLIASGIWALRFIFSINDDDIKAIQVLSSWNSFPRGRESDHNVKLANRTFENVFNQISDCLYTQENKNFPELWNFLESNSFPAEVAACQ